LQQQALKPPLQKYTMVESYFFPMSPRYQNKIKEYQLMHQISILKPK
ncbi:porin, partial [Escherichia coli]